MKRPIPLRSPTAARAAFTLVEIMMALGLSLLLLAAVITMFGKVTESISDSRALLEMADRLRLAEARLQLDLAGVTVTMNPPCDPANNQAYFEYREGGTVTGALAQNTDAGVPDPTVGQVGDSLMFVTRSNGQPFVGRAPFKRAPLAGETPTGSDALGPYVVVPTIASNVAEVAWFVRGHTLHRRVLLICPQFDFDLRTPQVDYQQAQGFYAANDISVHVQGTLAIPNTLADLTRRECRFAHDPTTFPFSSDWGQLGLPTLAECSSPSWTVGTAMTVPANKTAIDFWSNRTTSGTDPWPDNYYYQDGTRVADDIILTNVIGFDVKAWDPDRNMYVDLGNGVSGRFSGTGHTVGYVWDASTSSYVPRSLNCVYDTWSTHYESVGTCPHDQLAGRAGRSTNGIDDQIIETGQPANGLVDDANELLTSPPYPVPLRGIQVKIRCFEPDSKQIREVTVVQDFLPQ
jgi:type II secretory pathway component PulJ